MARPQLKSSYLGILALIGLILVGICTVGAAASSPKGAAPSPPAEVELICHTDNPAECYPKIFQPTDEFQIVHEDQDLPKGLHVRLNVQTGRREAKINVPDEVNPDLEGLPVDSSIVVVDQEQAEEVKIPRGAPEYDAAGKIKTPKHESGSFYEALAYVKKGSSLDQALEMLEDISHDIYYGLKISEDYGTVKQLFCLANTGDIFKAGVKDEVLARAKLAALTLSSTLQNNPKALAEVEKHWAKLKTEKCPNSDESLSSASFRLTSPGSADSHDDPALAKVRVAAINGLLRSPVIRKDFLSNQGTEFLLQVLAKGSDDKWEPAQKKVGYLLLDNFLDADMGATLGEWPLGGQDDDKVCKERHGTSATEGCWDWSAKKLTQDNKGDKGHWSHDFLKKLKQQRTANRGRVRDEL
ncbi:hypothetical protein GQ53DRAFT_369419 [Thozetella sp. PMI_491]|nr:hypothetical protein GQ53DRAFT_369419 [Thozetella sp. PMI_491]